MKYLHHIVCVFFYTVYCQGAWACPNCARIGGPREPQHGRKILSSLTVAYVSNAADFIAALADQSVGAVRIAVPELSLPPSAWDASGFSLPIVLRRNVTIEGDPKYGADWPTLSFENAKGKMRLAGNVTLNYRYLFSPNLRNTNPTRAPGMDILAPTLDGELAILVLGPGASSIAVCFPQALQLFEFTLLPRPSQFPGTHMIDYNVTMAGCINTTTAPPLKRCWPGGSAYILDLAFYGADYDDLRDSTVFNNYLLNIVNSTSYCDSVVDEACLLRNEPLVCFKEADSRYQQRQLDAKNGGSSSPGSNSSSGVRGADSPTGAPAALGFAPSSVYGSRPAGGGLTSGARLAVICAATGAGTLLAVAAVGAAVLVARRRHRARKTAAMVTWGTDGAGDDKRRRGPAGEDLDDQQQQQEEGCSSSSDGGGGGGVGKMKLQKSPASAVTAGLMTTDVSSANPQRDMDTLTDGSELPSPGGWLDPAGRLDAAAAAEGGSGGASAAVLGRGIRPTGSRTSAALQPRPGDMLVTPRTRPRAEVVLGVQLLDEVQEEPPEAVKAAAGADGDSLMMKEGSPAAAAVTGSGHRSTPPKVELLPVVLGRGTFGRVVEGMFGGRRVAVKLMAGGDSLLWGGAGAAEEQQGEGEAGGGKPAADNAFRRSFVQEVQVLSRVQHPNVVQLLAACVTPPQLCLVMELMEASLEKLMYGAGGDAFQSRALMPLEKVLHIGIDIANALAYLHPTIVHRDLKPGNVLLNNASSDNPIVKLSDFGLSRLRVTVASTMHPDAGTPPYMAPECFDVNNRRITHQSDMYSLGVILWEMLTGTQPWSGVSPLAIGFMVTYQGLRLPLVGHMLDQSRFPPKLVRLMEDCWDTDPARRPAAAEAAKQMALALEELHQQRSNNGPVAREHVETFRD